MRSIHPPRVSPSGFTLLELMVTLAIASILLSIGVPSFNGMFDKLRLKNTSEQIYSHMQRARFEAVSRKVEVGVNFSADNSATWAYGISDANNGSCDTGLTTAGADDACTLVIDDGDGSVHGLNGTVDTADKVLMLFTNGDHRDIKMQFTGAGGANSIVFDPVLGTARDSSGALRTGEILLESNRGLKLKVVVGVLGNVRICSPDGSVSGYRGC